MVRTTQKDRVDSLIQHFWRNGYLILSRKYGKYLPNPTPIGTFEVDAIGKYKKKYAYGITISDEELQSNKILSKINFLASQHLKYSNKKVTLFIGVSQNSIEKAKELILMLGEKVQKSIKVVGIPSIRFNK